MEINSFAVSTVESVFEEKQQYLIVALVGKVGSGCSSVADLFATPYSSLNLSIPQPGEDGLSRNHTRVSRILQRYYRKYNQHFYVIKVRSVITSFLLENKHTWSRVETDDILSTFKNLLSAEISRRANDTRYKSTLMEFANKDGKKLLTKLMKLNEKLFKNNQNSPKNGKEVKQAYAFVTIILPLLATAIHDTIPDYTEKFQQFGNELRVFGQIWTADFKADDREKRLKKYGIRNEMFTIAERINRFIKCIQRPNNPNKKKPIAVVIDSMKNMYESNYLKDRYSAYYLVAVTREESVRVDGLASNTAKKLTREKIEAIDYNERPSASVKGVEKYLRHLLTGEKNKSELREYIETLLAAQLVNETGDAVKYFQTQCSEIYESLNEQKKTLNFNHWQMDESLKKGLKEQGVSSSLIRYYDSILNDPLRILMYLQKLHLFFLQDVESCIQNADIFLSNNESVYSPRTNLKLNIIRYISLMMHPGLVLPTEIERCMQIAYTAKVNSGCLSRQVGAVVTDKNYRILSISWNDVPCGQVTCAYRNLLDLQRQADLPAYSDYEADGNGKFQAYLKRYNFANIANILKGLPGSFCFKSIHENITGNKNPMEARSMHGEEKALFACDQQQVQGGILFTTSSPCEMCAKNAKDHKISKIYYIEPYPGISQSHICNSGDKENRAVYELFEGAIGRAYTQLYTPVMPYKDELSLRGFPDGLAQNNGLIKNTQPNTASNSSKKKKKKSKSNPKKAKNATKKCKRKRGKSYAQRKSNKQLSKIRNT